MMTDEEINPHGAKIFHHCIGQSFTVALHCPFEYVFEEDNYSFLVSQIFQIVKQCAELFDLSLEITALFE